MATGSTPVVPIEEGIQHTPGAEALRQDSTIVDRQGLPKIDRGSIVTGKSAYETYKEQQRLHAERTAHHRAVCVVEGCDSTDVGIDFRFGDYYCMEHRIR